MNASPIDLTEFTVLVCWIFAQQPQQTTVAKSINGVPLVMFYRLNTCIDMNLDRFTASNMTPLLTKTIAVQDWNTRGYTSFDTAICLSNFLRRLSLDNFY